MEERQIHKAPRNHVGLLDRVHKNCTRASQGEHDRIVSSAAAMRAVATITTTATCHFNFTVSLIQAINTPLTTFVDCFNRLCMRRQIPTTHRSWTSNRSISETTKIARRRHHTYINSSSPYNDVTQVESQSIPASARTHQHGA